MSCIEILESSDISSRPFNDRFHDVMRFFQLWYRIKNDFSPRHNHGIKLKIMKAFEGLKWI